MVKTVEEVKGQKKGLREAARMYSVPTTSLKCRVDTGLLSEAKPGSKTPEAIYPQHCSFSCDLLHVAV